MATPSWIVKVVNCPTSKLPSKKYGLHWASNINHELTTPVGRVDAINVWVKLVDESHAVMSVKDPICKATVFIPPVVSLESSTFRAIAEVETLPSLSVWDVAPSTETIAPTTGSPLSNTVISSSDNNVNSPPVRTVILPSTSPPVISTSHPGCSVRLPLIVKLETSRSVWHDQNRLASIVKELSASAVTVADVPA